MPLATGARVGAYQIVAPLGAGGMGEVYRARDSKLNRDVAIKVLPTDVVADRDRLARFEREAQVLASLNDPHIAAIYGVEDSTGTPALVMELVDGPTLADRIANGPIPLDEALPIAKQIAEALETAHEQGIIHRDLKPANVKVRPDGTVKVLDFGLAKAFDPLASAVGSATMSPTITTPAMMTGVGVILGTAAYMSPEQARGHVVDRRADIWAFGCVLFEMLTGNRPFVGAGDTVSDVVAAVLTKEPDWTAIPTNAPPYVLPLVRQCLQKDARKRLPHIGVARLQLEDAWISQPISISRRAGGRGVPFVAGVALAAALSFAVWWGVRPEVAAPAVGRFSLSLPDGQDFSNGGRQIIAIAPDGSEFVYVANRRLYRRTFSDLVPQPIPGIDGNEIIRNPVYSPDAHSMAYFGGDVLKRIAVTGGASFSLGTFPSAFGLTWGSDGILLASNEGNQRGVLRVAPSGGPAELLLAAGPDEVMYGPQMLPGGKALIVSIGRNTSAGGYAVWDKASIVVQRLGSSERRTLITDASDARYVASGHLLYAHSGVLFAVPFDLRRLQVSGAATAVVQGVARAIAWTTAATQFDVSTNGSLVYVPGPADVNTDTRLLAIFDRNGARTSVVSTPAANINHPRVSPDGKRVAFAIDDDTSADVWTYELGGATAVRRLTFGGRNRFPIWTSDGERIAFQSDRDGDRGIYWQRADGVSAAERLTKAGLDEAHVPEAWSPRGDGFLFRIVRGLTHSLQFYSLQEQRFVPFGGIESRAPTVAAFSPDGRWVAYENGQYGGADRAVYVQPFPATGARYEVPIVGSGRGQRHPLWSPDGRELLFTAGGDVSLNVAGVRTQPSLTFSNPVALPKHNAWMDSFADAAREWDVLPDGQHFIGKMWARNATGGRASQPREIDVVLGWFDELKKRAPTK